MKTLYLDLETTGLDETKCGIFNLAYIFEMDGEEFDRGSWLMNPGAVTVEADAIPTIEKSGYTVETLHRLPAQQDVFKEFLSKLNTFVDRYNRIDKIHLACYNSKFDERFLRAWFKRNKHIYYGSFFWSDSLCALKLASWVLRSVRHKIPNFELGTICGLFKVPMENAHTAFSDTEALRNLMHGLENHLIIKNIQQ